ncbi:short-chain dehydrogenase [Bacillus sp. BRMEA1]|uniref:short-chain dehydrogenase n=1 Tax=Neobacillus endophyticus TaxID=2738405 RepID=UPI0015678074|nr:short-chain dehydrogenase [Neobacillus endophyticus]NRD79776.1 short-chain dehydrogenase [Neobacillus endophyticus]
MKHALVIGGTGMLSDVSLWLVNKGYHVSVIGRDHNRMDRLIRNSKNESLITPILVDYKLDIELKEQLRSSIKKNGQFEIVVAWIHSGGENVLDILAKETSSNNAPWKLFHVLGSRANLDQVEKNVPLNENCQYHQIQLGFVIEGEGSRWLTNEEISNGVIESIKKDRPRHLIGVLEPASMRPL